MKETERMKILKECAQIVAKSKHMNCASSYATSSELWSLWWKAKRIQDYKKYFEYTMCNIR